MRFQRMDHREQLQQVRRVRAFRLVESDRVNAPRRREAHRSRVPVQQRAPPPPPPDQARRRRREAQRAGSARCHPATRTASDTASGLGPKLARWAQRSRLPVQQGAPPPLPPGQARKKAARGVDKQTPCPAARTSATASGPGRKSATRGAEKQTPCPALRPSDTDSGPGPKSAAGGAEKQSPCSEARPSATADYLIVLESWG